MAYHRGKPQKVSQCRRYRKDKRFGMTKYRIAQLKCISKGRKKIPPFSIKQGLTENRKSLILKLRSESFQP